MIGTFPSMAQSNQDSQSNDHLFVFQKGVESRWFTPENPSGLKGEATKGNDGRKRRPHVTLAAGKSIILAEAYNTSGVVRRIWFAFPCEETTNKTKLTLKERLRGMRLDFYWDGAKTPAVSAPFGDFFCQSLGQLYTMNNAFFQNPEGRNPVCTVPMPFRKSMKLVLTNETASDIPLIYYEVDCTWGDKIGDDSLYFHAYWSRTIPSESKLMEDFAFLPEVKGKGRFLGVNFGINTTTSYGKTWWGEGEVKIYLDGDTNLPTLCGTGTEDYAGTSWGIGQYSMAYMGCPYVKRNEAYGFYRFHIPDPIFFSSSIKATIQQIGAIGWTPENRAWVKERNIQLTHANKTLEIDYERVSWHLFDRLDDWSACAYFYLDKPENGLPPLAKLENRLR